MKHPIPTTVLAALFSMALSASGATYTWHGGTDTDWTKSSNWVGNAKPPIDGDNNVYGTDSNPTVIKIATTGSDPASNIPAFANKNGSDRTPHFEIENGASLSIAMATGDWNGPTGTGTIVSVASGGNLTWTYGSSMILARDGGAQTYDISGNFSIALPSSNSLLIGDNDTARVITMNLDGGNFALTASDLQGAKSPGQGGNHHSYVNLDNGSSWTSTGSLKNMWNDATNKTSPTLAFDFADTSSSVTSAFGDDINSDSDLLYAISNGIFTSTAGLTVVGSNNGDGTFTVTAVPEPSFSFLVAALAGLGLLCRRRGKL